MCASCGYTDSTCLPRLDDLLEREKRWTSDALGEAMRLITASLNNMSFPIPPHLRIYLPIRERTDVREALTQWMAESNYRAMVSVDRTGVSERMVVFIQLK